MRLARRTGFVCLAILLLSGPVGAEAPVVPLPEDAADMLSLLGEGVVGEALPARPIDDPARLRHLATGTWVYRLTAGPHKGQTQRVRVERVDPDDPAAGWQVETGDEDIQTLVVTTNHEVMKLSQTHLPSDRTVAYRPGLVLDPGMAVGQHKTVEREISTTKSGKVEYTGTLRYTTRYLGAYRVKTPAGSFDARLLHHEYEMKLGPADAHHASYGLYADDVGNVADASTESVSAVLIYRRKTTSARVLAELPGNR